MGIIKKEKAHFRIVIMDLSNKKSKSISLSQENGYDIEHIKKLVEKLFTK